MKNRNKAYNVRVRHARRDKNEAPIIDAVTALGAICQEVSQKDVPDYLVAYRGCLMLWEIKNPQTPKEKRDPYSMLKDGQAMFRKQFERNLVPVFVVWSKEMALDILGLCRPGKAITVKERIKLESKHLIKLMSK